MLGLVLHELAHARQDGGRHGGQGQQLAHLRHLLRRGGAHLRLHVLQQRNEVLQQVLLRDGRPDRLAQLAEVVCNHVAHAPRFVKGALPHHGEDKLQDLCRLQASGDAGAVLYGKQAHRVLLVTCELGEGGDHLGFQLVQLHEPGQGTQMCGGGPPHHGCFIAAEVDEKIHDLALLCRAAAREHPREEAARRHAGRVPVAARKAG
mmetsp:Transcript_13136/g.33526  ORF Transcript_13136/g.33526 Transcript_13136/m.33526 type:complete len:205 (+) Transcript_13136:769-1383(+)